MEEGLLYNKLYLRLKYMRNKSYINATGCLNIILGKENIGCCDNLN
jgi:hypothetical protein